MTLYAYIKKDFISFKLWHIFFLLILFFCQVHVNYRVEMRKNTLIISTLKTSTDYKYHSDIVIEAKCQLETLNVWYFLTDEFTIEVQQVRK